VTVANELAKRGQLESVDKMSYLASLTEGLPELANLDAYVSILRDKSTLRKAIFAHQRAIEGCLEASEPTPEILERREPISLTLLMAILGSRRAPTPPARRMEPISNRRNENSSMRKLKKTATAPKKTGASRRRFLGYLSAAPGLATMEGATRLSTLNAPSAFGDTGPLNTEQRRRRAFTIRRDAAQLQRDRAQQPSLSNGDELLYPSRIATFTKGLPHNDLGEVDLTAFSAFKEALNSDLGADFEAIPLRGTAKLANPQASYCYSLEGADSEAISIPPAPASASAQMAAEIAESYWFALTRDVAVSQYATDPTIARE